MIKGCLLSLSGEGVRNYSSYKDPCLSLPWNHVFCPYARVFSGHVVMALEKEQANKRGEVERPINMPGSQLAAF